MHQQTIAEIVEEINEGLAGRFLGKIFQLSSLSLALDFGSQAGYLFISVDPVAPRLHLMKRRVRELEKQSLPPSVFAHGLRTQLGGGRLLSIVRDESERIVRFSFLVGDEIGESHNRTLVAQLTGRSANLLLMDANDRITHVMRVTKAEGQQVGDPYQPPARPNLRSEVGGTAAALGHDVEGAYRRAEEKPLEKGDFLSISAAADDHYSRLETAAQFATRAKTLLNRLQKGLAQRAKLKSNLTRDLIAHGDPEQHKRMGDLLLANIVSANREGNTVTLTDYYSEDAASIEIEVDEDSSLQDEAARYFARYTKAKRAAEEIKTRLTQLEQESTRLLDKRAELERIIASRDEAALALLEGSKAAAPTETRKGKQADKIPGVRRYRSSDGYEILVGRAAHTNDRLTFRVARPHDLWLHAADYPGSHVVVRNQTRGDIPHRTIIEAAQLAARFSQASNDSKVTVHYTQRKFLSKPKGAAPGLVRMSSFKTITVEPSERVERI